jgi:hypothetical protein
VPSGSKRDTYQLGGDGLLVTNKDTGATSSVPLPTSFPSFSHPQGVAHDTDLDIVAVVTLGGEGFFYRYDAKRRQWLDYRSMNDIDVTSLVYDQESKSYVARTSYGATLRISNQGEVAGSQRSAPSVAAARDLAAPGLGPPVKPVNERQLPLIRQDPPRGLATEAQLVVVSGYGPSLGVIRVRVNRPGKRVLLVLSTLEKALWRLEPSIGTTISGVVLASVTGESGVIADSGIPVYLAQLPFAYEVDNINFREMLQQLNARFGVTKVDAFSGTYRVPSVVDVDATSQARAELTLEGVAVTAPASIFDFELATRDLRPITFRNDGTSGATGPGLGRLAGVRTAISVSGRQAWILAGASLQAVDLASGQKSPVPLPGGFPPFSWPTAVAYDVDLDIVTVVTLGGEGFFYRYDAKKKQWLDYRSLNNIDITSIAYDPQAKRYLAWTSEGGLMSLSSKGEPLGSTKDLKSRLPGFGALYDGGNDRPPPLILAPRGPQIALVHLRDDEVSMIWTYDEKTGAAKLTYKRAVASAKPMPAR